MTTTLDWFGCATFRLRTAGLTVMLDAYIDRADIADGPGLTPDAIESCDWIVVGHSHFDHLYGAERIAANTGATIIGSYETVRVMEQAGVPLEQMICVSGGERVDLGNGVTVGVYPSQHSCVWSHKEMSQSGDVCLGDLGLTFQEQRERYAELLDYLGNQLDPSAVAHLVAAQQGDRGDGGTLVYFFETPEGSILYQDTSGHWSGVLAELRPDVAIMAAAGRGNVNGEPVQGSLAQFVVAQTELVRPSKLILNHHDNWLPGFSIDTDMQPIRTALAQACPDVELLEPGYVAGTVLF